MLTMSFPAIFGQNRFGRPVMFLNIADQQMILIQKSCGDLLG
jgi:hypothetical protein